ncbi:MAG TPA: sigma-70 family RNA polymerase sigma factor [Candidatus Limnocylindrales bacterium]|jgi:RNA polymerase sigma-70 factor (ECF subfamily)|nr:sigma-70 family RNA polymerase sigma factor [Candidatus Limnocylindrales bacterium]
MLTGDEAALDDERLVARIAAGSEPAFVTAYDRHATYLFGAISRFMGDREIASEVVQDAFMTLWRRADSFDARAGSLLTWLLAVARHRAIDRMRAEGRRPMREAASLEVLTGETSGAAGAVGPSGRPAASPAPRSDLPPELIAGATSDPGTIASRRWTQSVVRTSIASLPEHERQVIVMGYAMDLSQSQIAERLEWPIGTVKSRTRRALAQLRSQLAGVLEAEDVATAAATFTGVDR